MATSAFKQLFVAILILAIARRTTFADDTIPVTVTIDASRTKGDLRPVWRLFGYDECNFTYMKDGRRLLEELGQLSPAQVYIRCHHLLTSGDGTPGMKWGSTNVYTEDASGNPVYNWTIVDRIFDTYMANGVKPYVQIGFMPKDLSTRPDLYPTNIAPEKLIDVGAGQAYPPKDYKKWGQLAYRWADHCIQRYGKEEVQTWYWEVWNEPNIVYWKGTPEQYYELYDYAVDGVRRALPAARVGGNEAAGDERSLRAFLNHCVRGKNYVSGKVGSPIDFISFHAKGSPKFVEKHVQTGIAAQLTRIDRNFAVVASFPELKGKPIVIGESDPDGMAARPVSEAPELGYRNTAQFPAYTAACFAREFQLADKYGVNFEGALTWSFEFENKPYFPGYRVLSSNGIDLPILNLFRMFARMRGKQVDVVSSMDTGLETALSRGVRSGEPDVYAIASVDPDEVFVLVYDYRDDDVPSPAADVSLVVSGLPANGPATIVQYRIDAEHSDAYTRWKKMDSPQPPTPEQYSQLQRAGQLATVGDPERIEISGKRAQVRISMPSESVELLILRWK